jgi:hypothetical protein
MAALTPEARSRAPLWADLLIIVLGVWGFLRQCSKSLLRDARDARGAKGPHELESSE